MYFAGRYTAPHANGAAAVEVTIKTNDMSPILRSILAVVAGLVAGSVVNMGLIMIGGAVVPAPEGADVTTMEGLKASMHLFQPKNFVFPFLAHALGTLAGALAAAAIAGKNKMKFALGIAVFFLAGGVYNVFVLPSPVWFTILDLVVAYLPMGFLAGRLTERKQ